MMTNLNNDYLIVNGGYSINKYDETTKILDLSCNDFYEGLPEKVFKTYKYIHDNNIFDKYTHVCKLDDDMTVHKILDKEKLSDYCGIVLSIKNGNRRWHIGKCSSQCIYNNQEYKGIYVPWCLGGHGYVLSKQAINKITQKTDYDFQGFCIYEDLFIGLVLYENNIYPKNYTDYKKYNSSPDH